MGIDAHRMMAFLSPAFPTGAFAYSHGLEQAIADGAVTDAGSLANWLETLLRHGAPWNDAVLFAAAMRGEDVADLAEALAGSRERHTETMNQGAAFARTASAVLGEAIAPAALSVAVAQAARAAGISAEAMLPLYLHAVMANLVSVAVRLVPLGQTDGQIVLHGLFGLIDDTASRALTSTVDDLGNAAWLSDIAAMRHETLETRIFRS